jgi:hypothetical protein
VNAIQALIALLKDLLNLTKVANVTPRGMMVAAGLAVFFWPPRPLNVVPTVLVPVVQASDTSGSVENVAGPVFRRRQPPDFCP